MVKHISCHCKCKFNSKKCDSNQKCNNETGQRDYKKKIIVGILAHVFVKIASI